MNVYLLFLTTVWSWGGNPLVQIEELDCQGTARVELIVREVRLSLAGGLINFTTRAYHRKTTAGDLKPMLPGPTIKMKAGQKCELQLMNELPVRDEEDCKGKWVDGTLQPGYFCSDTTNLHTHGLWIDPNEDFVGSFAFPGKSWNYTYNLRLEHMPGTFWYHAHHHGSTMLNVYGGQYGALIVEPASTYASYFHYDTGLSALYEEAQLLVLHHAFFGGNDDENGCAKKTDDFWSADYVEVAMNYSTVTIDPNVTYADENLKDFYMVNNQYQPVVSLRANHPMLLRFVHASGIRIQNLIVDAEKETNKSCEIKLIARDGIFQYTPYSTVDSIYLLQGSRADVAFKCPAGIYNVRAEPNITFCHITGWANHYIQDTVFTLKVETDINFPARDFPTTQVEFPWYLNNCCHKQADSQPSGYYRRKYIEFTVFHVNGLEFKGGLNNKVWPGYEFLSTRDERVTLPWDDPLNPWIERYCIDEQYDIRFHNGDEDWCGKSYTNSDIKNAVHNNKTCLIDSARVGFHPYHQHVHSFQIVGNDMSHTDIGDNVARLCEWRDTIPNSRHITIRFRPQLYTGDVVAHCHLNHHEDHGMMGLYDITDDPRFCHASMPTFNRTIRNALKFQSTDSNLPPILNDFVIMIVVLGTFLAIVCVAIITYINKKDRADRSSSNLGDITAGEKTPLKFHAWNETY